MSSSLIPTALRQGSQSWVFTQQRLLVRRNLSPAVPPNRGSNLQRRNGRLPTTVSSQAQSSQTVAKSDLPYGMRRVDYSEPPPRWVPPPPPPPPKNPVRRYFGGFMLASCTALFVWIYFNQDESVYEYWKSVERGDVPIDDDEDDLDEDIDLTGVDEWEDDEKNTPRR